MTLERSLPPEIFYPFLIPAPGILQIDSVSLPTGVLDIIGSLWGAYGTGTTVEPYADLAGNILAGMPKPICLPLMSGKVTVTNNRLSLNYSSTGFVVADREILVRNNTSGGKTSFYRPFPSLLKVDGKASDSLTAEVVDVAGNRRPLTVTLQPLSFVRVDVFDTNLNPGDSRIVIKNLSNGNSWSSQLSGTVHPFGTISALIEGTTGDSYSVEVTDATGAGRSVTPAISSYNAGSGNLTLRATIGAIDPTKAEIDSFNAHVPADQQITGAGVTKVVLGVLGTNTFSELTVFDASSSSTTTLANGAFIFAFNGNFEDNYYVTAVYEDGKRESTKIYSFNIIVRDPTTGGTVKEIRGQVPPRGVPLQLDVNAASSSQSQLMMDSSGFVNIDVQAPLTFSFSEPLNQQSVITNMLLFDMATMQPVSGHWLLSNVNRTATFIGDVPLQMGKEYRVAFSGVTTIAGRPLATSSLLLRTYKPLKVSSIVIEPPHLNTGFSSTAPTTYSYPFKDVEYHRKGSGSTQKTILTAATGNASGYGYHLFDVTNPRIPFETGHTAAGKTPRHLKLFPKIQHPTLFDQIYGDVPLIGQPTTMSCWATSAAMMVAWRDQVFVDPSQIAAEAGYWNQYQDNSGLPFDNQAFWNRYGMVIEPPQTYSVASLNNILDTYGAFVVMSRVPSGHVRVVYGISGDGTAEGTNLYINDPWDVNKDQYTPPNAGSQYTETFLEYITNLEKTAKTFFGDPAAMRDRCNEGSAFYCALIADPAKVILAQQCAAGNEASCTAAGLPGAGAMYIAHFRTKPPLAVASHNIYPGLRLRSKDINELAGCSDHVSAVGSDLVFEGQLLSSVIYNSFGSAVNFLDITNPDKPCRLGGKTLTRNPETLPAPTSGDHSADGTVKQYGFARGVDILSHAKGYAVYSALGELGIMPVDTCRNITDMPIIDTGIHTLDNCLNLPGTPPPSPLPANYFIRQVEGIFQGDYVDLAVVGNDVLALNNNFGGLPTLDAFDANMGTISSVGFDVGTPSKVHQFAVARNVAVDRNGNGTIEADENFDFAFIGGSNGITIVNIRDHSNMSVVGTIPMPRTPSIPGIMRKMAVSQDGKTLFAGGASGSGGDALYLVDVSEPFRTGLIDQNGDLRDDRIRFTIPYPLGVEGFRIDDKRGLLYVGNSLSLDIWAFTRAGASLGNHAPVADAGPAQTVDQEQTVTLDGSASSDPDGDHLIYRWKQTAGTPVTLSDAGGVKPTFTAPKKEDTLTFQLIVSDGLLDSPPATVTIKINKKDQLRLSPVLVPIAIVPGSKQLTVELEHGDTGLIDNVTAAPETKYEWFGNGLIAEINGISLDDFIFDRVNQVLVNLGYPAIPKKIATVSVSPSGLLSVNNAGLQVIRATYGTQKLKSNPTIVLAGIKLDKIDLAPLSVVSSALQAAFKDMKNPWLILTSDVTGNPFITSNGAVYLKDATFDLFGGVASVGMSDLLNVLKPVIQDSVTVLAAETGPLAPLLGWAAQKAFGITVQYAGTQALTLDSATPTVATVTNDVGYKGIVSSQPLPGLTSIRGTLDLLEYGKASSNVMTWVLPKIDSVKIEPQVMCINSASPATPGPKVRTFAHVTAGSTIPIPLKGKFQSYAEAIDRTLPGGLAEWGSLTINKTFTVNEPAPNFKLQLQGNITATCAAAGSDDSGCTIQFNSLGLGFHAPTLLDTYTVGLPPECNVLTGCNPTLVTTAADTNGVDTHIVHSGVNGKTTLDSKVAIPGMGELNDPKGKIVVSNDPLCVIKNTVPEDLVAVNPGDPITYSLTVVNNTAASYFDVSVVDELRYCGAVQRLKTLHFGAMESGAYSQLTYTEVAPSTATVLTNSGISIDTLPGGSITGIQQFAQAMTSVCLPPNCPTTVTNIIPPWLCAPLPMINEVIVEPQAGSVDQFIEFYTNTGTADELRNWTLEYTDKLGTTKKLTLVPSDLTMHGRYAVLKNPPGGILATSVLTLRDTVHTINDKVDLGAIQAVTGFATGVSDEALARIPDSINTLNITDFKRRPSTIGSINQ